MSAGQPQSPTVKDLCRRVGLSRQAYYQGQRQRQRLELAAEAVADLVKEERQLQPRLGTRKLLVVLAPKLQQKGLQLGRDRFFDLLRPRKLLVPPLARRPRTTDSRHHFAKHANLLRHILPSMAHQVWVADLTYISTSEGLLYLSLLTDSYSRKIVGWCANDTLEAEGCLSALRMGLRGLPPGARPIHHSDRGTQYCCHAYTGLLGQHGLPISMTEQNHCYENAQAERVNGILKVEYGLEHRFASKALALGAIGQAIGLYNERRPHMALGYRTPAAVHAEAA